MMVRFFRDIYIDAAILAALVLYAAARWEYDAMHITSAFICAVSILLWIKARMDLGSAFAILPSGVRLVTNGIYSKIRHPMYLFWTIAIIGIACMIQEPIFYIAAFGVAIAQLFRARAENAVLAKSFGAQYGEYKKDTWF